MSKARTRVNEKGQGTLAYLLSKTGAYQAHLETLILLNRATIAYTQAFVDHAGSETALARALAEAERMFVAACDRAKRTARRAAEVVDHPSDLAILFQANVWGVALIEQLLATVRRVLNYHRGLPYWQEQRRPPDGGGQDVY